MIKKNFLMTIPSVGIKATRMLYFADRDAKGGGTLEKSLAVSYKVKHALTIQLHLPHS